MRLLSIPIAGTNDDAPDPFQPEPSAAEELKPLVDNVKGNPSWIWKLSSKLQSLHKYLTKLCVWTLGSFHSAYPTRSCRSSRADWRTDRTSCWRKWLWRRPG